MTMINRLEIRTRGGFDIRLNGELVTSLESRMVEALLIYLAANPRPFNREVLAEFFWPDRDPETSRTNLRVAVFRLRQQLAPFLTINRQPIALIPLPPDQDVWLNSRMFEELVSMGQVGEALDLYRGDFLAGFSVNASPAFEGWMVQERERLHTLAVTGWEHVIEEVERRGDVAIAIQQAQGLITLDPLHEPAYWLLMRLLAGKGQRGQALSVYKSLCQVLSTELNTPPEESTTQLFQAIQTGKFQSTQFTLGAPVSVSTRAGGRKSSFPLPFTALIGRTKELSLIEARFEDPICRLMTLIGPGGIGETRLAVQAMVGEIRWP